MTPFMETRTFRSELSLPNSFICSGVDCIVCHFKNKSASNSRTIILGICLCDDDILFVVSWTISGLQLANFVCRLAHSFVLCIPITYGLFWCIPNIVVLLQSILITLRPQIWMDAIMYHLKTQRRAKLGRTDHISCL